jgi:hypothetical protein
MTTEGVRGGHAGLAAAPSCVAHTQAGACGPQETKQSAAPACQVPSIAGQPSWPAASGLEARAEGQATINALKGVGSSKTQRSHASSQTRPRPAPRRRAAAVCRRWRHPAPARAPTRCCTRCAHTPAAARQALDGAAMRQRRVLKSSSWWNQRADDCPSPGHACSWRASRRRAQASG